MLRSGNEHAFRHTALCLKVKPSSASDKPASKIHKHTQDWDDMQCEEAFHSLSYFSPKPETTSIISKVNKNRYTFFIAIPFWFTSVPLMIFAVPKSVILMCMSASSRMFSGFKSLNKYNQGNHSLCHFYSNTKIIC